MAVGTAWLGRGDPTVVAGAVRTYLPMSVARSVSTFSPHLIARQDRPPAGRDSSCVAESRVRTMQGRG